MQKNPEKKIKYDWKFYLHLKTEMSRDLLIKCNNREYEIQ